MAKKRTVGESNKRMTELLGSLAKSEGVHETAVPGVTLMRVEKPLPRSPVMYEPSIVIVGQGRKRGYLGGQVYTYDAHNYLVLSLPMPFECETDVGARGPLLAVAIRIELPVLSELLMKMKYPAAQFDSDGTPAMCSTPLDAGMSEATVRLLECLKSPRDAAILGPQITREITYRVLCGKHGNSLRALLALNGRLHQIQRTLSLMHSKYFEALDVKTMAEEAGMSVSAFHHNFKSVTAASPLQYLKNVRLHKARMLIVQEGIGASAAALRVGYESHSQFSREFKRFFGATPTAEADRIRNTLGLRSAVAG